VAEALQVGLEYDAEVTVWSQGVFGLSGGTLETLVETTKTFDFSVFVLTPEDLIEKRGDVQRAARDNVIFELGLFMGSSGRHRTLFVHPRLADMSLPSDLAGITALLPQHTTRNAATAIYKPRSGRRARRSNELCVIKGGAPGDRYAAALQR